MPNKPDALVSDEFLELRCKHGVPLSGSLDMARELQLYRSTWDAAIAEAKKEGIREGLEMAEEIDSTLYVHEDNRWNRAIRQYRDAIRALKESL